MSMQGAWIEPFLEALAENNNISDVCRQLEIPRRTVYDRKLNDPEFAKRFAAALEVSGEMLEAAALSRALDGWLEPVVHQGQLTGKYVRKYDNNLLMRMLAARNPRYRQNSGLELSGKLDVEKMTDAELAAEIARLQKKLADADPADPSAELA